MKQIIIFYFAEASFWESVLSKLCSSFVSFILGFQIDDCSVLNMGYLTNTSTFK